MVQWTEERINQVYEMRQAGKTANEIAAYFGCKPHCVREIARAKGFRFGRNFEDVGSARPHYRCMRCKRYYVDGRWQRCDKCREYIREIQGGFGEYSVGFL